MQVTFIGGAFHGREAELPDRTEQVALSEDPNAARYLKVTWRHPDVDGQAQREVFFVLGSLDMEQSTEAINRYLEGRKPAAAT